MKRSTHRSMYLRRAALAAALLASLVRANATEKVSAAAAPARAEAARTCGTADPTAVELDHMRLALQHARDREGGRPVGGTIQIALHVLYAGGVGNVSDEQIQDQIRELNRNYLGTGYRFSLASVDRTESRAWFKLLPGTGDERHAKQALAIDPARRLNVYTCAPGQNLLGWSTFPFSYPESHFQHGVVIHWGTLPGGPLAPYDLGRTLTHEVGHYLGLFHTFQGGCEDPGDEVSDTPAEASPNFACPASRNTCPAPGDDPIHNYMDYSVDECLTEFTPGQDARMDALVPLYRPSLLDASPALIARETEPAAALPPALRSGDLEFPGAWPNPFRLETTLRFSLPHSAHVRLRVYDVAGHLVQTIVDAAMPPGEHSAPLRAEGLAPGIYFASLRVDDRVLNRSVLLLR